MTPSGTPEREKPSHAQQASAETKAEHSDARWASWAEKGAQEAQVSRRRSWMIASVIVAGAVIWLIATNLT